MEVDVDAESLKVRDEVAHILVATRDDRLDPVLRDTKLLKKLRVRQKNG